MERRSSTSSRGGELQRLDDDIQDAQEADEFAGMHLGPLSTYSLLWVRKCTYAHVYRLSVYLYCYNNIRLKLAINGIRGQRAWFGYYDVLLRWDAITTRLVYEWKPVC